MSSFSYFLKNSINPKHTNNHFPYFPYFYKKIKMKIFTILFALLLVSTSYAQQDPKVFDIIDKTSAEEIKKDITKLVSFGTRNTFSDTTSNTRGIGAARRWLKSEYEAISKKCDGCLEVFFQGETVPRRNCL